MKVNLKEYIHPQMDLLFVALNAPVNSNNNGHWFTNNMSFWNLLYRVGIITKPIKNLLEGDEKVFGDTSINHNNWSIGVTDLIGTIVETDSSKVEPNNEDVKRILEILNNHQVKKLCLMHNQVGEAFRVYSGIPFNQNRYGQIGTYKSTEIYEVPFHNASVFNKDSYYALLVDDTKKVSTIKNQISIKSITQNDIEKGQLRITVDFKEYFPKQSCSVNINYLGRNYLVGYTYRDGKSSILKVGSGFMEMMKTTSRSHINIVFQNGQYILTKL